MNFKKLALAAFVALVGTQVFAQDYNVQFSGTTEQVKVKNLNTNEEKTLEATGVLVLKDLENGIAENAAKSLNIYPNPTSGSTTVSFNNPEPGSVNMQISSIDGRMVASFKQEIPQGEVLFNVNGLAKGSYVFGVYNNKQLAGSGKLSVIGETLGSPEISLLSTAGSLKSGLALAANIEMQYKTGDKLQFTTTSGTSTTVMEEVFTASKTLAFEFASITSTDKSSQEPGLSITLTGENFGTDANAVEVKFGSTLASVSSANNTQVVCQVPTLAAGAVDITLSVDGRTAIYTGFSVAEPTPNVYNVQFTETLEQVTAKNLNTNEEKTLEATDILVLKLASKSSNSNVEMVYNAGDKIQFTTTSGTSTTVIEEVFTASKSISFSFVSITSTDKSSQEAGLNITLTGENFGTDADAIEVKFATTVANVVSVSATQLVCQVPNLAAGAVDISLAVDGKTTVYTGFSVAEPAPDVYTVQFNRTTEQVIAKNINTNEEKTLSVSDVLKLNLVGTKKKSDVDMVYNAGDKIRFTSTNETSSTVIEEVFTSSKSVTFKFASITSTDKSSQEPGLNLTLTGANFATDKNAVEVKFGSAVATIVSVSATQVVCQVPNLAAGAVEINLTAEGRTAVYTGFSIMEPAPNVYNVQFSGTTEQVTAKNLNTNEVKTLEATDILVLKLASKSINSNVEMIYNAGDEIEFTATNSGSTTVLKEVFTASKSVNFSFVSITSTNKSSQEPDLNLTLIGDNFGTDKNAIVIKFGSAEASIISISNTEIVCVVPNVAVGAVNITATIGDMTTVYSGFSVAEIVRYSITFSGTTEQIVAKNLNTTEEKTLAATDVLLLRVASSSKSDVEMQYNAGDNIKFTTTSGTSKTVVEEVFTATKTLAFNFATITATDVNSQQPGLNLTITGTNFGSDAGAVDLKFGTTPVSIISVSDNQIVCEVPNIAAGALNINLAVDGKTAVYTGFSVAEGASITGASIPTPVKMGSIVTLTGTGFGTDANVTSIIINGVEQTINSITETQIEITVVAKTFNGAISISKGNYTKESAFSITNYEITYVMDATKVFEGPAYRSTVDTINSNIIFTGDAGVQLLKPNGELSVLLAKTVGGPLIDAYTWSPNGDTLYMNDVRGRVLFMKQDTYVIDTLIKVGQNTAVKVGQDCLTMDDSGHLYASNSNFELIKLKINDPTYSYTFPSTVGNSVMEPEYCNNFIYYYRDHELYRVATDDSVNEEVKGFTDPVRSIDNIKGLGLVYSLYYDGVYCYNTQTGLHRTLFSSTINVGFNSIKSIAKTKEMDLIISGGSGGIVKAIAN